MSIRVPLFGKILAWFFLDLVLIVVVLVFVFKPHLNAETGSLLGGLVGNRVQALAYDVFGDLSVAPKADWDVYTKKIRWRVVPFIW